MTTETPAAQHIRFGTSDPVEAREFLDRAYGGRLRVRATPDTSWRMTLDQVHAGSFSSGTVQVPAELTFDMVRRGDLVVNALLDGGLRFDDGKNSDRFGPGGVCLANHPGSDGVALSQEVRLHAVTLSEPLLTDVAGGSRVGPAHFLALAPVAGGAARWWATTRFVDDLLAEPETASSPLLIGSAGRLLAATAMTVFPNTVVPPPTAADRTDGHPVTLRRALGFIEASCDRDISLADIARAACVTPRAVQLAFRRHLDTTPLAHLRRIRLERAHHQLREAVPGDGTTVTAVAARWGFTASRFSQHYRATYGRSASSTLRG